MNALDPKECTRCGAAVPADSAERPISLSSHVYAPVVPRPTMPGGTRPDGTVVPPSEVWWEVAADYEKRGPIAALLCPACVDELSEWIYSHRYATRAGA